MGEFNTKSFIDAMKKRYNEDEAEHRGVQNCGHCGKRI
jgi:hypothetical protein